MAIIITMPIFITILVCYWWRRSKSSVTGVIRNWPVVGMLPGLIHNINRLNDYLVRILKQSGYTFVFRGAWFSSTDYIITSDPSNVNHILSRNFSNYSERPKLKMIMEPSGDGIFSAEYHSWKFQRRLIHSIVNQPRFESAIEKTICVKIEKGLVPVLEHHLGLVVDMQDVFQRFNFDSGCQLILGHDPQTLCVESRNCAYEEAYYDIMEGAIRRHVTPEIIWKLQRWLRIGEEKKFFRAWKTFDQFLYHYISLKLENFETEDNDKFDLLTGILQEKQNISDIRTFLRDMAFNVLGAGRDAMTSALTWCLWLISQHPSVENKILEEIKQTVKPNSKPNSQSCLINTVEQTNRLVYLHAVLSETMRLYPPVPINHKAAAKADVLPSGHQVCPNTNIIISFYAMGRMENIWGPDYLEFKPERWISDKGDIVHVPSYQFPAFNGGPKSCVGKNISFVQMKMIMSAVIWNYRIQTLEFLPNSLKPSMVLYLEHGFKVRVLKRG